ncbi:MAG: hypothetical protein WA614_09740 [Acidimicrobiales bacterium]
MRVLPEAMTTVEYPIHAIDPFSEALSTTCFRRCLGFEAST